MIFVTVGAQMPFDRMCKAVDAWAAKRGRSDVFAQIGETEWRPSTMRCTAMIAPPEFKKAMQECSVVVAHAGMGSILTALQYGKPILVMPRRGDLRETRNDHQVATAKRFKELGRVAVAFDESELERELDRLGELRATERISPWASDSLLNAVRAFVRGEKLPAAEPQRSQRSGESPAGKSGGKEHPDSSLCEASAPSATLR